MKNEPPQHLPDCRDSKQIEHDLDMANEFADKGSVKHFALRLGFMPHDEADAEAILTRCIREMEWYRYD